MEGLVNYSSEDTQDDYPYSKVVNIKLAIIHKKKATKKFVCCKGKNKRWLTTRKPSLV